MSIRSRNSRRRPEYTPAFTLCEVGWGVGGCGGGVEGGQSAVCMRPHSQQRH